MPKQAEHTVDQDRIKNSLFLCVRSVRYMTEQLVTIVSSLNNQTMVPALHSLKALNSGNPCVQPSYFEDLSRDEVEEEEEEEEEGADDEDDGRTVYDPMYGNDDSDESMFVQQSRHVKKNALYRNSSTSEATISEEDGYTDYCRRCKVPEFNKCLIVTNCGSTRELVHSSNASQQTIPLIVNAKHPVSEYEKSMKSFSNFEPRTSNVLVKPVSTSPFDCNTKSIQCDLAILKKQHLSSQVTEELYDESIFNIIESFPKKARPPLAHSDINDKQKNAKRMLFTKSTDRTNMSVQTELSENPTATNLVSQQINRYNLSIDNSCGDLEHSRTVGVVSRSLDLSEKSRTTIIPNADELQLVNYNLALKTNTSCNSLRWFSSDQEDFDEQINAVETKQNTNQDANESEIETIGDFENNNQQESVTNLSTVSSSYPSMSIYDTEIVSELHYVTPEPPLRVSDTSLTSFANGDFSYWDSGIGVSALQLNSMRCSSRNTNNASSIVSSTILQSESFQNSKLNSSDFSVFEGQTSDDPESLTLCCFSGDCSRLSADSQKLSTSRMDSLKPEAGITIFGDCSDMTTVNDDTFTVTEQVLSGNSQTPRIQHQAYLGCQNNATDYDIIVMDNQADSTKRYFTTYTNSEIEYNSLLDANRNTNNSRTSSSLKSQLRLFRHCKFVRQPSVQQLDEEPVDVVEGLDSISAVVRESTLMSEPQSSSQYNFGSYFQAIDMRHSDLPVSGTEEDLYAGLAIETPKSGAPFNCAMVHNSRQSPVTVMNILEIYADDIDEHSQLDELRVLIDPDSVNNEGCHASAINRTKLRHRSPTEKNRFEDEISCYDDAIKPQIVLLKRKFRKPKSKPNPKPNVNINNYPSPVNFLKPKQLKGRHTHSLHDNAIRCVLQNISFQSASSPPLELDSVKPRQQNHKRKRRKKPCKINSFNLKQPTVG